MYDKRGPKRAVNSSIDADLLEKAKALEINLSGALEARLVELVKERMRDAWLERNEGALDAYNERIETRGLFSDGARKF